MDVHIALLGRTKEPVLKGFRYYKVDRLYLLHSSDSGSQHFEKVALDLKKNLSDTGFNEITLVKIDAFDMRQIVDKIVEIAEKEKGSTVHINITGGTNLMAGAACSASFFIGAKAYYVLEKSVFGRSDSLENQIIELPVPRIPSSKSLEKTQKMILRKISEAGGAIMNPHLIGELRVTPQKLSYHIRVLESNGFIETSRGGKSESDKSEGKSDRRVLKISLTEYGRLSASWNEL